MTKHHRILGTVVFALAFGFPFGVLAQDGGSAGRGTTPKSVVLDAEGDPLEPQITDRFLHGFRLGYLYVTNVEDPVDSQDPNSESFESYHRLRSPHSFVLGYEATLRLIGHDWLNVLLTGNVLASGIEQSRFFPSLNGLIGFELNEMFQIGVGVSVTPTRDKTAHMIVAAGWTPKIGAFYIPVHFFFIPDVDNHHRLGSTIGVNF